MSDVGYVEDVNAFVPRDETGIPLREKYFDFHPTKTTEDGSLYELNTVDALRQALKNWLSSSQTTLKYRPYRGGYFYKYLLKPWTSVDVNRAIMSIRYGIEQEFASEGASVKDVQMFFDEPNKMWDIYLDVTFQTIGESVQMQQGIGI